MSSFKSVSWTDDDDILTDKLNQMASNEDYLNDHLPDVTYGAYGIVRTDGIKMKAGVVSFTPNTYITQSRGVHFGNFFTVGCKPIITVTLATTSNYRCHITIKSLTSGVLVPDHTGFICYLNNDPLTATSNNFPTTNHVHWIALGY